MEKMMALKSPMRFYFEKVSLWQRIRCAYFLVFYGHFSMHNKSGITGTYTYEE